MPSIFINNGDSKMKKIILLILVAVFVFPIIAIAAATEDPDSQTIDLSSIDADWTMTSAKAIDYVIFVPGAADDILVIRTGSVTGPRRIYMQSDDGYPRIVYMNGAKLKLAIEFDDQTLTAGHMVLIGLTSPQRR